MYATDLEICQVEYAEM